MKQQAADQKRVVVYSFLLFVAMGILLTGCGVYMAANQPRQKDLSILKEGTPRSRVIAELGPPVWTGQQSGSTVDVFAFRQGYSGGARAGRAFIHGVLDVATWGLWVVVATPAESLAGGADIKVEVAYDANDRFKATEIIAPKEPKPAGNEESLAGR